MQQIQPNVIYIDESERIESLGVKFSKYPYWHITDSTGAILYQKYDPNITANKRPAPLEFAESLNDAIEYARQAQEPRLVLHYGNNKADIGNKPKTFIVFNQDEATQMQADPILFLAKLQNNPIAAALEGLAGAGTQGANNINQLALLSKLTGGKNAAATELFERFLEFQQESHARELETQKQMFDMQIKAAKEANTHQIELLRLEMQQANAEKKGGLNGVVDSVMADPRGILEGLATLAGAIMPYISKTQAVAAATSVAGAASAQATAAAATSTSTANTTAASASAAAPASATPASRTPRRFEIDEDEEEEGEENDDEEDDDSDDDHIYEIDASQFTKQQRHSLDNVMGEMEFNPDLAKEIEDFIRFKKGQTPPAEQQQQ